jgi:REP element-mobilizing transposase RayT
MVTMRLRRGVADLRGLRLFRVVHAALSAARDRNQMRICHYSVQSNHFHLIVEAASAEALARGMQGLCVRLARRLNHRLGRRGSLFADRYHSRALKTPRQVRTALRYVLLNARKHSHRNRAHAEWELLTSDEPDAAARLAELRRMPYPIGRRGSAHIDPYSSALWFDGWKGSRGPPAQRLLAQPDTAPLGKNDPRLACAFPEVMPPRTRLLARDWRHTGLLGEHEAPAPAKKHEAPVG